MCRDLIRPAGEAVAGGTRERGLVNVSPERFGEYAAKRLGEPDPLHAGATSRDLRSVSCNQRGGLVETGQCGAG